MKPAISPDSDSLSRSQISRINRLQMTRYRIGKTDIYETGGTLVMPAMSRERQGIKMVAIILGLICLWVSGCLIGFGLFQKHSAPAPQLFTSLSSNLDEQSPSITIYP